MKWTRVAGQDYKGRPISQLTATIAGEAWEIFVGRPGMTSSGHVCVTAPDGWKSYFFRIADAKRYCETGMRPVQTRWSSNH